MRKSGYSIFHFGQSPQRFFLRVAKQLEKNEIKSKNAISFTEVRRPCRIIERLLYKDSKNKTHHLWSIILIFNPEFN